MNWKYLVSIGIIIGVFVLLLFFLPSGQKTGVSVFNGKITNMSVPVGTYSGIGEYDTNCTMGNNGMITCDAGIVVEKYGVLNFHYTHDMSKDQCIDKGHKLNVEILDETGNAKVIRG